MARTIGPRELELRAQRERLTEARERATKVQHPPGISGPSDRSKPVDRIRAAEGKARRAAPETVQQTVGAAPTLEEEEREADRASRRRLSGKEVSEIAGASPNIRDEQMAVVTDAIARQGPDCPHCDTMMLKNPSSRSKTFQRAWLCPICDSEKLPAVAPVEEYVPRMGRCVLPPPDDPGYADAVKRAAAEVVETVAKKAKKSKSGKVAKVKKPKIVKIKKVAVPEVKQNGAKHSNRGRPRGGTEGSLETLAYWKDMGISRRTYYRYSLAGKLSADGSRLLKKAAK